MIKGLSLAKFLPVPTDSTRSLNALSCPPFISEFRRPLSLTPHPLSSGGGLHDLLISDTERASSPCTSNPPFGRWSRNPTVSTIRPITTDPWEDRPLNLPPIHRRVIEPLAGSMYSAQ